MTATQSRRRPMRDALGRERRAVTLNMLEVRRADENAPIMFEGHAAVFNTPTRVRDWFGEYEEQVAAGAFRETIQVDDIRMLVNHDPNLVLARNTAGTLWLAEDDVGLFVRAELAPTSYARDLAILLERGDISQMSFGFTVIEDRWDVLDDGTERRTLLKVRLWEVSPVTFPAYPTTDAGLRAIDGAMVDALAGAVAERVIERLEADDGAVRARLEVLMRHHENRRRYHGLS